MNDKIPNNYFILPADKMDEFKATAAKLGCTTDDLLAEQLGRLEKDLALQARVAAKAKEIDSAQALGEGDSDLWPSDLNECLLVASILAHAIKQGVEEFVVELE